LVRTAIVIEGVERRPSFWTGYGEAIQGSVGRARSLDCFVAALLAMTIPSYRHGKTWRRVETKPRRHLYRSGV